MLAHRERAPSLILWPDRWVCFAFEGGDHWKRWQSIAAEVSTMARARGERAFLSYVFRTPDLKKVPRPSWLAARPNLDAAHKHGFRIIELTPEEVCEVHAARELYSNALQGNIAYSGGETLAWLQSHFALFVKNLASRQLSAEGKTTGSNKETIAVPANDARKPALHPIELDAHRLRLALTIVREQRVADISAVLGRLGSEELRDHLPRGGWAHPCLRALPAPPPSLL